MEKIEEVETEHGTISIFRRRSTNEVIYELGGYSQSSADGRGTSLSSYIHAIFGLLSQAKARNTLIIGGAGGTLATMLANKRRQVTIVDINAASFTMAKRHFRLPEAIMYHIADGKEFLRADTNFYDAIVLDAFHGDSIPSHLQSAAFFELVRERLTPRGAVFANVLVKHDFDNYADNVARTMKRKWIDVRVLDAMGFCSRNAIIMAGRVSHLRPPRLLAAPVTNVDRIDSELRRLRFRPWKFSRWDFGR